MADVNEQNAPLSPDMVAKLRRARDMLNGTRQMAQKCLDCGIDVRVESSYCDALCERFDTLLHHFGGIKKTR